MQSRHLILPKEIPVEDLRPLGAYSNLPFNLIPWADAKHNVREIVVTLEGGFQYTGVVYFASIPGNNMAFYDRDLVKLKEWDKNGILIYIRGITFKARTADGKEKEETRAC